MQKPFISPHHGGAYPPALEHATVADAMHAGILTCDPSTTLTQVARMMSLHRVHCVAVMAQRHPPGQARVAGIISDRDLMRAGIGEGREHPSRAREFAHQPVVTVEPALPLRAAGELMLERGLGHLVVIHPEALLPLGILSSLDVIDLLAWGEG